MQLIRLETRINAPIDICFDLSRSINLHLDSTEGTGETAIAGVTEGLIGLNETVTWRARHVWWQELTSKIVAYDRPRHFRDTMQKGYFKYFEHDHYFEEKDNQTIMTDEMNFASPFGLAGQAVDALILKSYLSKFLKKRNDHIKEIAESENKRSKYLKDLNQG